MEVRQDNSSKPWMYTGSNKSGHIASNGSSECQQYSSQIGTLNKSEGSIEWIDPFKQRVFTAVLWKHGS